MKLRFLGVAAAIAALLVPATLLAASAGSNVTLAKSETHNGTYYALGQTVTLDGNVNGDVVCAGQEVTINGSVSGDVICGAQTLTVNGPVSGSIRVAGQTVNLNGTVGRNVTAAAQTLELNSGAKISGEIAVAGQTVVVSAPIAQLMYAAAQDLTLNSAVAGDVNAEMSAFHLGPDAKVAGSFTYTSSDSFAIDKTQVAGDVVHHVKAKPAARQHSTAAAWLGRLLYWIVSATASMLLAVWLVPRLIRSVTNQMLRRPQASFGWGALGIIVVPVLLFVMMLTVIGIPLALILTALWVGILLVSGAFSGVALGQLILGRKTADQEFLVRSALIGVPLVEIVLAVPWLGLLGLVGAVWVLGGMLLSLSRARALG
jgi:cytoskeletal protein CcmA (bactofilin family)